MESFIIILFVTCTVQTFHLPADVNAEAARAPSAGEKQQRRVSSLPYHRGES